MIHLANSLDHLRRCARVAAPRGTILLLGALAAACHDECDPGQKLIDQTCHDVAIAVVDAGSGGSAGTTPDASADGAPPIDGSGGAGAGGTPDDSAFGRTCATDGDCGGVANYCPLQPGKKSGYCTAKVTSCSPPPSACPEGWSCFDLASVGVMGQPAFCLKP